MRLLDTLGRWLRPVPIADTEAKAIERAIDLVDPRLRVVSGYRRRMAPAVRRAVSYCDGLVDGVPGPIDMDIRAFGRDPLVHAFFSAPEDIGHMLGASRAVREFLSVPGDPGQDAFYGLIGMRRKEKTVMGLGRQGDLITDGVPQRLLYFADHTLGELSPSLDLTRQMLRASAFDSLVKSFAAQLAQVREERQEARTRWDQERAQARLADGAAHALRAQEMAVRLRDLASSLEPAHVLEALAAWLADPEPRLHLVATSVSVDRLGVLSKPDAADPEVQTLNFPELVGRDRRRWIVMLTRISRDDALRAVEEHANAHRYLII